VPSEPPSAIFDAALERSGLQAAINDGSDEGEERWANVLELRGHAAEFDEIAPPEGLARFLEEVALVERHGLDKPSEQAASAAQ
jgi:superfamily I DNA/RNA helicase